MQGRPHDPQLLVSGMQLRKRNEVELLLGDDLARLGAGEAHFRPTVVSTVQDGHLASRLPQSPAQELATIRSGRAPEREGTR